MKNNQKNYCKAFYTKEALQRAITDYIQIANVLLEEHDDCYQCTFSNCVVDMQRVMNEFDNYLIELMNVQGERE